MTRLLFRSGVLFALSLAIAAAGCSSRPAERQVRTELQQWFESRWPGVVRIVEYETLTRARDGETCVLEYRAKARVVKDASGCVPTCCGDVCIDRLVDGFRWIEKTHDSPRTIRKGDLFEMRGRKRYEKTEKGWSCDGP